MSNLGRSLLFMVLECFIKTLSGNLIFWISSKFSASWKSNRISESLFSKQESLLLLPLE